MDFRIGDIWNIGYSVRESFIIEESRTYTGTFFIGPVIVKADHCVFYNCSFLNLSLPLYMSLSDLGIAYVGESISEHQNMGGTYYLNQDCQPPSNYKALVLEGDNCTISDCRVRGALELNGKNHAVSNVSFV